MFKYVSVGVNSLKAIVLHHKIENGEKIKNIEWTSHFKVRNETLEVTMY
jgi:hypothetical protein